MLSGEFKPLVEYDRLGPGGELSIPTPDHCLPLLYVLGTMQHGDSVTLPIEGVDGGSVSILSVRLGSADRDG